MISLNLKPRGYRCKTNRFYVLSPFFHQSPESHPSDNPTTIALEPIRSVGRAPLLPWTGSRRPDTGAIKSNVTGEPSSKTERENDPKVSTIRYAKAGSEETVFERRDGGEARRTKRDIIG